MKIIITTENTELWRSLANSLDDKNIKFIDSYSDLENNAESQLVFCFQPVTDLELFAKNLQTNKIESALLFYQQSEFVLANAVSQGENLETATNQWQQKGDLLLNVHKQYRRKIKLINLNQAFLNQTTFAEQMNEQGVSILDNFDYQLNSDFNLLLACQHVRQEQRLAHLNLVLTASSLPVCETIDLALDSNKVLELNVTESSTKKELEKNIETLSNQLKEQVNAMGLANQALNREQEVVATLQEELEQLHLNFESETQKFNQTELKLSAQVKDTSAILEREKTDRELLELQLNQVQGELEQFYSNFESETQKYKQTELKLSSQLKDTETKLEGGKSEMELFELQLGQVQRELEEYFLSNQTKDNKILAFENELELLKKNNADLDKQLTISTNSLSSLNKKIVNLNVETKQKDKAQVKNLQQIKLKQMKLDKQASQIAKAKSENDILKHNLNQAKAELARIKSSTLWKSADPVRKLVKAVGKMDKKKARLQENIGLLLTSEYFDAAWYLETYPDVAASEINPAEHYLKFGAKEGRFPSPQFDGNWYLQRYPDIGDTDINPLIHFIKFGISEGRSASPKMLVNQNKP
ncbi:hypothetical protein [Paraglaciecola marina]|uniref:hypothetical protein n=1 Tax=Paraglaciecola marina TaxID=2500157 RepID=UPI00105FE219|nr:hypothetical protein [Paraglaciecola marina]